MENNWSVYKHTFPDDSVYYGITSYKPEERWSNGLGYEPQRRVFLKIVKFGWDNIKHKILAEGLDEETARRIESELIHATEYEKCNNTVCNVNPNPPKKEVHKWYDDDVTDDIYVSRFEIEFSASMYDLADDWRVNYALNGCRFPFAAKLSKGAIELNYMYGNDEYTYFETYRLDVPTELHTYLDYWKYLQETHETVLVKSNKISNKDIEAELGFSKQAV